MTATILEVTPFRLLADPSSCATKPDMNILHMALNRYLTEHRISDHLPVRGVVTPILEGTLQTYGFRLRLRANLWSGKSGVLLTSYKKDYPDAPSRDWAASTEKLAVDLVGHLVFWSSGSRGPTLQ